MSRVNAFALAPGDADAIQAMVGVVRRWEVADRGTCQHVVDTVEAVVKERVAQETLEPCMAYASAWVLNSVLMKLRLLFTEVEGVNWTLRLMDVCALLMPLHVESPSNISLLGTLPPWMMMYVPVEELVVSICTSLQGAPIPVLLRHHDTIAARGVHLLSLLAVRGRGRYMDMVVGLLEVLGLMCRANPGDVVPSLLAAGFYGAVDPVLKFIRAHPVDGLGYTWPPRVLETTLTLVLGLVWACVVHGGCRIDCAALDALSRADTSAGVKEALFDIQWARSRVAA